MKRGTTIHACIVLAASAAFAQTDIHFTAIHPLPSNQIELIWSSDTNRLFAILGTTDVRTWDDAFCAGILQAYTDLESYRHSGIVDTNLCFFRVVASPPLGPLVVCHTNIGTSGDDTQVVIGTTNRDYVLQFGEASNDTQYASVGDDDDWLAQYGGTGADTQTVRCGTADDWLCQNGGEGDDTQDAQLGDGDDWVIQRGEVGKDHMNIKAGDGFDLIRQEGGFGHDTMELDGGNDDDTIRMLAGDGNDTLTYEVSGGLDAARIDGGNDSDVLTVNEAPSFTALVKLVDGTVLYSNGSPDTVITVMGLESIYVVGGDGTTNWSWSAP